MSSEYIKPEMKVSPLTSPTIIKAEHSRDEAERQYRLGLEEAVSDMAYWAAYIDGAKAQLKEDMNAIPAADVRPVVLCRDCEYWKQWDNTTHYLCTYVAGAKFIRNAEDFCSRGEKREES